jgi:hypothetical protein
MHGKYAILIDAGREQDGLDIGFLEYEGDDSVFSMIFFS